MRTDKIMCSTSLASEKLNKHFFESSGLFLVSPPFPFGVCCFFILAYPALHLEFSMENTCFATSLALRELPTAQPRRSIVVYECDDQKKTRKGPQSAKTLSLPVLQRRNPKMSLLICPLLFATWMFTSYLDVYNLEVYNLDFVDDECVPLAAHHESHGIARHQRRIIEFVQKLFSNIGKIATYCIPKLVILLLTNRSPMCFNTGKLDQHVESHSYVLTLRKVPWTVFRVLRPIGLKTRVSYQKTLSLTERSGRRFLTRDLAGLFSK